MAAIFASLPPLTELPHSMFLTIPSRAARLPKPTNYYLSRLTGAHGLINLSENYTLSIRQQPERAKVVVRGKEKGRKTAIKWTKV